MSRETLAYLDTVSVRMQAPEACGQAKIPVANKKEAKVGYTLHRLRKNFGIKLAEDGATLQRSRTRWATPRRAKPNRT